MNRPVKYQDVTRTVAGSWVTEASTIGLPPGQWPTSLMFEWPAARESVRLQLDPTTSDPECKTYVSEGGLILKVLND